MEPLRQLPLCYLYSTRSSSRAKVLPSARGRCKVRIGHVAPKASFAIAKLGLHILALARLPVKGAAWEMELQSTLTNPWVILPAAVI